MKAADIVRNLKLIISELFNIGLKVVATICGQMSANRTAINHLIDETKAKYLREMKGKRTFGFEINDNEIVPLFDPPHLLKQIRNHLLDANAKFIVRG